MNYRQVMKDLEAAGTAQIRKIYRRHLGSGPMFGVSTAERIRIRKDILRVPGSSRKYAKHDHPLAVELWGRATR